MAETLYGTKGIWNPLVKDKGITDDDYEVVRLATQGTPNSAVVGDFVAYDVFDELVAATPTTHRDVILAAAISADNQVTNQAIGWCGQIMEPVFTPNAVSGVAWDPSVALLDGTLVRILKKGARATTAAVAVDTAAHDHLPGEGMCIATVGATKPVLNTYTNTTPTGPENALNIIQATMEYIGRLAEVSEDISNESVVFIDWSGY